MKNEPIKVRRIKANRRKMALVVYAASFGSINVQFCYANVVSWI